MRWGSTIVEVGVETGETSRNLLARLPEHVRLVGVDPFMYNSTGDVELSKDEAWERFEIEVNFRYDSMWLEQQAAAVRREYESVQPSGRAQLLGGCGPGRSLVAAARCSIVVGA